MKFYDRTIIDKKLISRWDSVRGLFTTISYTYWETQKRERQTVKKQPL